MPRSSLSYRPGRAPRRWNRRTGLWVAVALLAAGVATAGLLVMPSTGTCRSENSGVVCSSRERQLGLAILVYEQDHRGHYPDSLAALVSATGILPDALLCPSTTDTAAALPPPPPGRTRPTTRQVAAALAVPGHVSYVYFGRGDWTDGVVPVDAIVLAEHACDHPRDGPHVLFGDGHVDQVPPARAARLIAAAAASTRPVSAATVP